MVTARPVLVTVLAHNEERRIAACLRSLPLDDPDIAVQVIVNGSTDATAAIARQVVGNRADVHCYAEGGKARSWNRAILDEGPAADFYVLVDGDAVIRPGSIRALVETLASHPSANSASGMPLNGRNAEAYRASLIADRGLFGDLYALRGGFVAAMRAAGIRLPEDLVGDDGLVAAIAKTDLANESNWRDERVVPCEAAGWWCEPTRVLSPSSWRGQYRRMIAYSVRHFQNRMISAVMASDGPAGLPRRLEALYPAWLDRFEPRHHPQLWWFDRVALQRMRASLDRTGDPQPG